MSLATTTDTAAIKPAPLSKYEIQRNEPHAAAQVRSDAKRREKNAPRRDDMAQAAYCVLLMMFNDRLSDTLHGRSIRGSKWLCFCRENMTGFLLQIKRSWITIPTCSSDMPAFAPSTRTSTCSVTR
ncbi:hypothetical protein [Methylobacterium cerastii]|uniref:hypothetical protein n=1 Tax=Methylobacterium cerastii TaxID=932741 RepID=UPI001EE39B71|nr:hypothetical protein [Methylobacterium cerastii]